MSLLIHFIGELPNYAVHIMNILNIIMHMYIMAKRRTHQNGGNSEFASLNGVVSLVSNMTWVGRNNRLVNTEMKRWGNEKILTCKSTEFLICRDRCQDGEYCQNEEHDGHFGFSVLESIRIIIGFYFPDLHSMDNVDLEASLFACVTQSIVQSIDDVK